MTYDASDRYVVMLGYNGSCLGGYLYGSTTWIFRAGGWTATYPKVAPSPRCGESLAYDSQDRYVLLFGGLECPSYCSVSGQTWRFSAGNWSLLQPTHSPSPRSWAGMTYDAVDRYVLLYGGTQSATSMGRNIGCCHDTWRFVGGQWRNLTNYRWWAGPPSGGVGLTYDSTDRYVLMLGSDIRGPWDLTWSFASGNWTNRSANSTLAPSFPAPPLLVDDPSAGYVLLSGYSGNRSQAGNASWRFAGGNWSRLTTAAAPGPMYGQGATFDPASARVILHPGTSYIAGLPRSTWAFSHGNWTDLPVYPRAGPPARYDAGMSESSGGVLLFGGLGASGVPLNDTWEYNAGFWTNLTGTVGRAPSPRYGMSMVFKTDGSGNVLLFGGTDGRHVFSDTWLFSSSWSRVSGLTPTPPARFDASMAFSPSPQRLVLFGGTNGTAFLNDTWLWYQAHWTRGTTSISPAPRARAGFAHQNHDPLSGELVLFGGENATAVYSDAWSFYGGNWTLDPGAAPGPLPVFAAAVGFLRSDFGDRAYIFGGSNGSSVSSSTWAYFVDNWTRLNATPHPSARTFAMMIWSDSDNALLLFGGLSGRWALSDTWELS